MKKNYLALLLVAFLFISGCETMEVQSSSSDSPSYEYGDSKQANLQAYLQNEIGDRIYFETDKYNISSAAAFVLRKPSKLAKINPRFSTHC